MNFLKKFTDMFVFSGSIKEFVGSDWQEKYPLQGAASLRLIAAFHGRFFFKGKPRTGSAGDPMASKNIDMKSDGKTLVITIDLAGDLGPSNSGKSTIVASTFGNVAVPGMERMKIGLTLFKEGNGIVKSRQNGNGSVQA
nr:hypothetical protein [Candidatus Sigynarchaeota archaeon]